MVEMPDGNFVVYVIQFMKSGETRWCDPDGEILPISGDEWRYISTDSFGKFMSESCQKAYNDCWQFTREKGFQSIQIAYTAMGQLVHASECRLFKHTDNYNKPHSTLRYKFRVVRITILKKTDYWL